MAFDIDPSINITEELEMLAVLIDQGQIELAGQKDDSSIRLVYLMNDAVESFLLFRSAVMTGHFDPDYEGDLDADLDRDGEQYVLNIRQGSSIFTVFYSELEKEVHLYNYGRLGHFWVGGYEYLRLMEYRLAIMRDKVLYLGDESSSETEKELAYLTEFPPLNYCCYAAAPRKYVIPKFPAWKVSREAVEVVKKYAREAGDKGMLRVVCIYEKLPVRALAVIISRMLHRRSHSALTDMIDEKIKKVSSEYPDREFGIDGIKYKILIEKTNMKALELAEKGVRAEVVCEEPFTTARDSISFKVFLMVWDEDRGNRIVRIEENVPD